MASRITCSNWDWLWTFFSQCINLFGCVWAAVKWRAVLSFSWKQNFVPLEEVFNIPEADEGTNQPFVQSCSSMGQKLLFLGKKMQFTFWDPVEVQEEIRSLSCGLVASAPACSLWDMWERWDFWRRCELLVLRLSWAGLRAEDAAERRDRLFLWPCQHTECVQWHYESSLKTPKDSHGARAVAASEIHVWGNGTYLWQLKLWGFPKLWAMLLIPVSVVITLLFSSQLIQSPVTTPLGLIMLKTTSEELACPREDLSVARKEELRKLLLDQVQTVLGLLTGTTHTVPLTPVSPLSTQRCCQPATPGAGRSKMWIIVPPWCGGSCCCTWDTQLCLDQLNINQLM